MTQPIGIVSGVGPGTGSALARRFAGGGHHVAMLARDAERLAGNAWDQGVPLRRGGSDTGRDDGGSHGTRARRARHCRAQCRSKGNPWTP
jgi:NAD(P)-dependent dehydrogenase (short-subunit alcohol dehydrogenase family)